MFFFLGFDLIKFSAENSDESAEDVNQAEQDANDVHDVTNENKKLEPYNPFPCYTWECFCILYGAC